MEKKIRFIFCLLALFLAGNAFAISGSYDVGRGASVPLPKGEWSLLQKSGSTAFGDNGEVVVLENSDPAVSTKLLVIHHTRGAERWRGDAQCFKKPGSAHTELYGSKKSALVVKCSRTWVHNGSFSSWVSRRNHKYWTEATEGLRKARIKGYFIQTEIELRNFNGRNVNVDLFTETPKTFRGKPVNYFYPSWKQDVSEWYLSWVEAYTESLQATFQYKKKAAPLLALGFGARSVADGPKKLDVAPVVTADSAPGKSLSELLAVATDEGARPAESIFIPITDNGVLTASQTTEVTTLSKVSPEPLAAAGLPSKQETQALAKLNEARIAAEARAKQQTAAQELLEQERLAVEDRAKKQLVAQQQLEQDRLALAKQKDSIAADLAAMRTMLAELKKANEEAANAEQVAAAPTAVETPAKPVVMARRRALVVGNETYKNVPVLENAAEDARAMAVALTGLGYEVDTHIDLTERGFKRALREFRADLNGGEEVLFFFAGHGVQLGNSNFLLPTDLGSDSAEQVKDESIELQKVLNDLADQKTKFALAVIDACRDNPFKQNGRAIGGRGLAPTTAATGQMVMFSAGAGQQALDKLGDQDKGKNGLFTRVFLEEMKRPGVSVDRVLRNVRQRVVDLARSVGHEQVPALYDQAVGEFYFKPK
ncbi:MAG: caspase family protein [Betaproteobacteria bacterium]|nr:caspase family protein [Betaproteobacteria bacterium]